MANRDNLDKASTRSADWMNEDMYWRSNFSSRPYAQSDRSYDFYQPGYRYGFESANRFRGRQWNEVESDLRSGWDRFEHRGQSAWEHVKDAVRDAWDRVAHRSRPAGAASSTTTDKY